MGVTGGSARRLCVYMIGAVSRLASVLLYICNGQCPRATRRDVDPSSNADTWSHHPAGGGGGRTIAQWHSSAAD